MSATARGTLTFSVRGPIAEADLPGLCARVCALFSQERPAIAVCECTGVPADARTVDALARLQLAARRFDARVVLRGASSELAELVELLGLDDVLVAESGTTPRAEPEGRRGGRGARYRGRT